MAYPTPVSDLLSNHNDQLVAGAKLLGKSDVRTRIFEAVYRGKKETKTIKEIMGITGLSQTHILKEGGKLAGLLLEKVPGGYKKIRQFSPRYKQIIALAKNPKKLESTPTKVSPQANKQIVSISFPRRAVNARFISISDVGSFAKVQTVAKQAKTKDMKESEIKNLFLSILGESGEFKDWGGEKSDLFSTRLRLKSKRVRCAIAFKGRGTKGKLVPSKMGKNGDQIIRLLEEPADVYFVVYNGQIDPSILAQLQALAIAKAINGQTIYYGVIDEKDLGLLVSAYK